MVDRVVRLVVVLLRVVVIGVVVGLSVVVRFVVITSSTGISDNFISHFASAGQSHPLILSL